MRNTYLLTPILVMILSSSSANADSVDKNGLPKSVSQFFTNHCVKCHGSEEPESDVTLHDIRFDSSPNSIENWKKILEAIGFAKMPPESENQPAKQEAIAVASWISAKLKSVGHESDVAHKLRQPAYANLLNHERLFDGSIKSKAFSPPRIWRIHPEGYENYLQRFGRQLSVGGPLSKPFTKDEGKGVITNYAALGNADQATLSQLMLNCQQIAQFQIVGFKKMQKDRRTKKMVERIIRQTPPAFAAILEQEGAISKELLAAAVEEEFQIVLNRSPDQVESTRYSELLERAIKIGGKARGLKTMAVAILLRPDAIYRLEIGLGPTDAHGRRLLSPYELAYAISYALTDQAPDRLHLEVDRRGRPNGKTLLDLAEEGGLETREDVEKIVSEIWDSKAIEKPRILRFFQEFFGYHTASTVFKGDRAGREFAMRHIVKDADTLVMHIVDQDRHVLRELLTTEAYFVQWPGSESEYDRRVEYITKRIKNKKDRNFKYFVERTEMQNLRPIPQANPTWRKTVRFYNLDERTWNYPREQPFKMPDEQRVGLLTHPAWLVAWSGNFDNDPIRRGKWVREHLLAGTVPDLPISVDAKVPEDPSKTLRQRLEVTRQEYCWQCHQKMDPLGLPFEAYNDFGQFRSREGLGLTRALAKPKKSVPTVTTGEVIKSGEGKLDGRVGSVKELMHKLAGSTRVRQSFVRHAFRYWMGRNERLTDSMTLRQADKAYHSNEGSFKALVVSLLTSDSFLYRK